MKKNRGIHKILRMLLCCVMLLGLLPITALAATITQVTVTIDAPQAGKAPDYSAKLSGNDYDFKTTSASNPFVVNGINWYDETAGNDLTATHKFIAGHTYTLFFSSYFLRVLRTGVSSFRSIQLVLRKM